MLQLLSSNHEEKKGRVQFWNLYFATCAQWKYECILLVVSTSQHTTYKSAEQNCTSEFTHVKVPVCTTLSLIFWEPLQLFAYFIRKSKEASTAHMGTHAKTVNQEYVNINRKTAHCTGIQKCVFLIDLETAPIRWI